VVHVYDVFRTQRKSSWYRLRFHRETTIEAQGTSVSALANQRVDEKQIALCRCDRSDINANDGISKRWQCRLRILADAVE
jgi:hypothetical protein